VAALEAEDGANRPPAGFGGPEVNIVLFRHGIAFDRADPDCPPDPDRPLTKEGTRRTRRAARGLLALGVSPEVVVTSDYLRAVETAQIACEELSFSSRENFVRTAELHPTADPRGFLEVLDRTPCREMLCVGHNPNLSGLLSWLVGAPRAPFTWLKKAGAARIDLGLDGRPPGRLVWLLEPKALRRLGAAEE
jgi:phosphohistidine phosphatase